MDGLRVAHHPTNGQAPTATSTLAPIPRVVSGLGVKADRLYELRATLRRLGEEERALTSELTAALLAFGLRALHGRTACAILESRTPWRIDPGLLFAAVGEKAFGAMSVNVGQARRVVAADFLEELLPDIGEAVTTPVLRVEPVALEAA